MVSTEKKNWKLGNFFLIINNGAFEKIEKSVQLYFFWVRKWFHITILLKMMSNTTVRYANLKEENWVLIIKVKILTQV